MPQARRKPAAQAEQHDESAVFATTHLLPNFHPGDRLDGKLSEPVLEMLLERGDASRERP